ncbi:MAG: hypothetical protein JXR34_08555, partial [Bacteroidales bacterium]|nr:hypothetical protein [Bacteroidales bacterium]
MNRNSIIGFALIFLILIGYSYFMRPSPEEIEKQRKEIAQQDSISRVNEAKKAKEAEKKAASFEENNDSVAEPAAFAADTIKQDTNQSIAKIDGPFAVAQQGEDEDIIITSDLYKLKISKKGGN